MVWSVVQPTLTPLDAGSRSSLATLNDEAGSAGFTAFGVRSLWNTTDTHWPAATCSANGSGLRVPARAAATSLVCTYIVRTWAPLTPPPPPLPPGTSTALMVKVWVGVLVGQGLPGLVVGGGLLPLVVGRVVSV